MKPAKRKMILAAVFLAASFFLCAENPTDPLASRDTEFRFCWEALQVFFLFQDSLPANPAAYATPQELYAGVHEPYTSYIPPDSAALFRGMLTTTASGKAGLILDSANGKFYVHWVISNSPAEQAGIEKGDTIVVVNDTLLDGKSFEDVFSLIRGNTGDERTFTLLRDTAEWSLSVILGNFLFPSVYTDSLDDSIAYIRISQFADVTLSSGGTAAEFDSALDQTAWASMTLLDVRGNPGGYLSHCMEIAGEFLPSGTPMARFRQRVVHANYASTEDSTYASSGNGKAQERRFVILADAYSASASELLVAILREQRAFSVVGQTTYGKARGQVTVSTPDSGIAKITFAKISPLTGEDYDLVGIEPDVETATSREALDAGITLCHTLLGQGTAKKSALRAARHLDALNRQISVNWQIPIGIMDIYPKP